MSKRIYATVRDFNSKTGEAALLRENGRVYTVRLSEVQSNVALQSGMRVSVTLDASEQDVMQIDRG